jgi:esterase/lipase
MTDQLKFLTAQSLRDCSNTMVDIAHGLGEHVTFAGLSAGGIMAAWVAQYRSDVDKVVIIAPSFTISTHIGIGTGRIATLLLRLLPDISTARFMPFQDGPTYSYLGYSSRALAQVMHLGFSVLSAAKKSLPAAQSVLFIINDSDPAVNNKVAWTLVHRWRARGATNIVTYEFGTEHALIHDIVDPNQVQQQTAFVYPILLDLITRQE